MHTPPPYINAQVSGSRKMSELIKISKAGMEPTLHFFELAFSPLANFGRSDVSFGDALFGGPPAERDPDLAQSPDRISVTEGFDVLAEEETGPVSDQLVNKTRKN